MSMMSFAKKALSTAARSKMSNRPVHSRPVKRTSSPKQAAARTAVRHVSKALKK